MEADAAEASSLLFAIFAFSILVLVLTPVSYVCCCTSNPEEEEEKPWLPGGGKRSWAEKKWDLLKKPGPVFVGLLWVVTALLALFVMGASDEIKPFDPFEILGVPMTATEKEIKKAYRDLSKIYHPDKNKDPKAQSYFAEYLAPAYNALTDVAARENYEKYGHPDGPQGHRMGVALPEFMFSADSNSAPWLLFGLVFCCILVPLGFVLCYLGRSQGKSGLNGVMKETVQMWVTSKHGVKETQSCTKVPDTLVICLEFLTMPTPQDQNLALAELKKLTDRCHPELKDKAVFWKRRIGLVKAHMLLLAHLQRAAAEIPLQLRGDLDFVLKKLPLLTTEFISVASIPRVPRLGYPFGYAWAMPYMGGVEFMQCLTRAIPLQARKDSRPVSKGGVAPALLQLPHMDHEKCKKLARKKPPVRSLEELVAMDCVTREGVLQEVGLSREAVEEVETALGAMPKVHVEASAFVEGEDEVKEGDFLTVQVRVALTRGVHAKPGFTAPGEGRVMAYAPNFPGPREELWHLLVVQNSTLPLLWSHQKASLSKAEAAGLAHRERFVDGDGYGQSHADPILVGFKGNKKEEPPKASKPADADDEPAEDEDAALVPEEEKEPEKPGQLLELKMMVPSEKGKGGKYDLQLHVMCDCWIGVEQVIPIRLNVGGLTKGEAEGRVLRARGVGKGDGNEEGKPVDKGEGEYMDDSDYEGSEDEEEEYEYDSEETGTEETGSEPDVDGAEEMLEGEEQEEEEGEKGAEEKKDD